MSTKPTVQDVIKHLVSLRDMMQHAIKGGGLPIQRFNEATAQVKALDVELTKLGHAKPKERPVVAVRPKEATRAFRRAAKRSQGNTLTQRMQRKGQA